MRRISALLLLAGALAVHGQTLQPAAAQPPDANAVKARRLLNEMVQALGGERWLNLQNRYMAGRIAAFYQGKPTGATVQYWSWWTPQVERVDLSEKKSDKHNWIQILTPGQCWEVTFRGKRAIQPKHCDSLIRSWNHSIEMAVQVWMKQPATLLTYDGQSLAERHLADQVTLLNDQNDSITIKLDADTHLPLSRSWSWRDPVYHDRNTDVEEYDDYHNIDGLQTPFTITYFHNGDMTSQRFVMKAAYNVQLPPGGFDADDLAAHIIR